MLGEFNPHSGVETNEEFRCNYFIIPQSKHSRYAVPVAKTCYYEVITILDRFTTRDARSRLAVEFEND